MSNDSILEGLYPFLHGRAQDAGELDAALLHSLAEKAAESRDSNARFFAAEGAALVVAARAVAEIYRGGGILFAMGNGGSSCDAAHIAVEFTHPVTAGRPALPAVNLVADTAMLSAVGNDVGFEHVFVRQLVARARPGDGLIGVSTSGNSANLLAAFAKAKEMGLATIGLAGRRSELADYTNCRGSPMISRAAFQRLPRKSDARAKTERQGVRAAPLPTREARTRFPGIGCRVPHPASGQ